MNFYVNCNKDAGDAYVSALEKAGHERVERMSLADFILFDYENSFDKWLEKEKFMQHRPAFIYPHTPRACWLWDCAPEMALPVSCNFVASDGIKGMMEDYGYPYHVRSVGFSRCNVKSFAPTKSTRLLFVPARPRADKDQRRRDQLAIDFVNENIDAFKSVTVCSTEEAMREKMHSDIRFIHTPLTHAVKLTDEMVKRIRKADIVIARDTVGTLAVALGKPTVFYSQDLPPSRTGGQKPKNYDMYRGRHAFPLNLEDMSIDEVLATREQWNGPVELWKDTNIGGNFDAAKFVRIVESYL